MTRKFRKVEFKDALGNTPSDYLADLLDADQPVMWLATFVYRIPNSRALLGNCINRLNIDGLDVQIWRLSKGRFHLTYAYVAARDEVCFLEVYEGARRDARSDGLDRATLFYSA